jgi:hypothetical protein
VDDEKDEKPEIDLDDIAKKRAEKTAQNADTKTDSGGVKLTVKRGRKPGTKKPVSRAVEFENTLPLDTFKEYSDGVLDFIPSSFSGTQATEKQKNAIAKTGRNVVVKRVGNAENFDEIMLSLCLLPLVIKWAFEAVSSVMGKRKNAKQTPVSVGPFGNGKNNASEKDHPIGNVGR